MVREDSILSPRRSADMVEDTLSPSEAGTGRRSWRRLKIGALALLGLLVVYYLGGTLWLHQIDDDPDFALASSAPEGGSAARGGRRRPDRPRDQHPSLGRQRPVLHARQPARQHAQLPAGHHRRALALRGRARRPDRAHPRLEPDRPRPGHRLRPAEVPRHGLDLRSRGLVRADRELGIRSIAGRCARCATTISGSAQGQATFETRADNLQATLERIAADVGSSSAAIDRQLAEAPAFWPDFAADDLFYLNKGRLYAYYLLLRALEADFGKVIGERDLGGAWSQMLDSFRAAATLQPWVVVNGEPDSQVLPSHLAAQGFFLLRARTQLKEITNILLK